MRITNRFSSRIAGMALLGFLTAMSMTGLNVNAQTTQSVDKPQITHAKLEQRNVKVGLAEEVDEWAKSAERPQWLGYAVPAISSGRHTCCGNSGGDWSDGNYGNCGPCRLENGASANSYNVERGEIKLEGPSNVVVWLRAEGRKIGGVRAVSEDCVVDAGGLQVLWLAGVQPAGR